MKHWILIFPGLFLLTVACTKEKRPQSEIDREKIEAYLAENNLVAQEHPSGLLYIVTVEGNGDSPTLNDRAVVRYKGYFLDGAVFDQTQGNNTASFPVGNLILGWQIALPLMKEGGKSTFLLPSELAYGSNPPPGIPRNEVLIFDIELIEVK